MSKEYDVAKARTAQAKLCKEKRYPHFAPKTGICWRCNKNIYQPIEHKEYDWKTKEVTGTYITGITVEKAAGELITGCPHCNISYCD